MIAVSAKLREQIEQMGEKDYPNETCGFILGYTTGTDSSAEDYEREAVRIIPVSNAREPGETYHRYEISPQEFLKAERTAAEQDLDVIGIYHSHPDHPAKPSEYDLTHGLPYYSYLIVSVDDGLANKLTSWRLSGDRSDFWEEYIYTEEE